MTVDIQDWMDYNRRFIRETFERTGSITPMAVALITLNPVTKEELNPPAILPIAVDRFDNDTKGPFARKIREICRNHRAVAVVLMHEAWAAFDMSHEDIREYEKGRSSLADRPGKKEFVVVTLQVVGMHETRIWWAEITREGKRATLGEFLEIPDAGASGRLTNLLGNDSIQ